MTTSTTNSSSCLSLEADCAQSESTPKSLEDTVMTQHCDVLIIGAGLAGLATALSLPKQLNVMVLAKDDLSACSSYYAQGGIAAVIDSQDTVSDHVSDTLIAGDGLCDQQATTDILSQGSDAIKWLLSHKVPFTTKNHDEPHSHVEPQINNDVVSLAELHLTQEGGHGCRRVAHADDATGRHIMTSLQHQILTAKNITLLPFHEALSLITTGEEVKHCIGAEVINTQTNTLIRFASKAVVLASGGLGQLFKRATAPNVCVGDGIMMAWEAGCRLANLEFIQFHPTGLVYNHENVSSNFLISEAVRGEGGLLLCPVTHQRFMPDYDEREELAPRDIVARAIATEIDNNGLGYVHLDISHKPAEFVKQHFPDIYTHCLSLGIDITKGPIPVAPTAHYTCGGVVTNANGQTDVQGLYAAGEVANTGLHGANRLASNSLLECVVVGRKIASQLATHLVSDSIDSDSSLYKNKTVLNSQKKVSQAQLKVSTYYLYQSASLDDASLTDMDFQTDIDFQQKLKELKQLMTDKMGIRRNRQSLKQALNRVLELKQQLQATSMAELGVSNKLSFTDKALNGLETDCFDIDCIKLESSKMDGNVLQNKALHKFRLQRLLTLASLLLQSALTRTESRGGHYREDYPNLCDAPLTSIIYPDSAQSNCLTRSNQLDSNFNLKGNKSEVDDISSILVAKAS
ncbi:L-aspartate oxidase [Psychrobacter sp.]|uniref:L-aspartate oxidase n=1 Tax=Psychrobacter sp. TaxID=56811 RepID=UPI0025E06D12|nr:L-aspartate oxidase [Psychrobacter sp.]